MGNVYIIPVNEVLTDNRGISELMKFYAFARQFTYKSVTLDISRLTSVDANLSSIILAIAYRLKQENKVSVFLSTAPHMSVFFRNGLISHLKGDGNNNKYFDNRQSTIPLITFNAQDYEPFSNYLKQDFFRHRGLEQLGNEVKRNLVTQFEEIFTNVDLHAETNDPVFACGQYFPEKNLLKFTIVDIGVGFLYKISEKTNNKINTDKDAIIWATLDFNSTKDTQKWGVGGTGLKDLKKYCENNNGSFHICSGCAYVNFIRDRTFEYNLQYNFRGTIVNIIFRNI